MTTVRDTYPAGFLSAVTAWMREHRDTLGGWGDTPPADAIVTAVTSRGTDWEGSTEGGFYSTFAVDVEWQAEGARGTFKVEGENMDSLWRFVVSGFGVDVAGGES